jgi:N-acetylglutamate synthase-like GNAT family acetyltransferase
MADVHVRFATTHNFAAAQSFDRYLAESILRRKIEAQEILIAERDGKVIGYLRQEYLWSIAPYIAMIHVLPGYRQQGTGRALLHFLESYLRDGGHAALYSSSQADEPEPQAWHRHMGFEECGIINGINEGGVGEIFFRKQL